MLRYLLCTAVLTLSLGSFAQSKLPTVNSVDGLKPIPSLSQRFQDIENTFEVIYSQTNYQILYTENLYNQILDARLATGNAVIQWDQFTTIIIYPYATLEDAPTQTTKQ